MYSFETKKGKIELTGHDLILKGMSGHDLMRDIKTFVKKLSLNVDGIDLKDPIIKEVAKLEMQLISKKDLYSLSKDPDKTRELELEILEINNKMTNLTFDNFDKFNSMQVTNEMPDIPFQETYELYKRILLLCGVSNSIFDSEDTTQDEHYKLIAAISSQVRGDLENLFKSSHLIKFQ
jgi:hypothetical protein